MTQSQVTKHFQRGFFAGPPAAEPFNVVEPERQTYLLEPGGQDYVGDNSYDLWT